MTEDEEIMRQLGNLIRKSESDINKLYDSIMTLTERVSKIEAWQKLSTFLTASALEAESHEKILEIFNSVSQDEFRGD